MQLFRQKAPVFMRWLVGDFSGDGIDALDAAAIFGNAGHECGGFTLMQEQKPTVPGSRGGYGWFQWTGPRRRAFEAWCVEQALDPASDKANYGYLVHELHTSQKAAIKAVNRASSLYDKVVAFEMAFERAGVKHYDSRMKYAEAALEAYRERFPVPVPAPRPAEPAPEPDPAPAQPPDFEPGPVPVPAPPAERPSWFQRIRNWFGSALTGGGLFYMDWRLFALGLFAVAGGLGFALWLFGKEPIKAWIKRHFG